MSDTTDAKNKCSRCGCVAIEECRPCPTRSELLRAAPFTPAAIGVPMYNPDPFADWRCPACGAVVDRLSLRFNCGTGDHLPKEYRDDPSHCHVFELRHHKRADRHLDWLCLRCGAEGEADCVGGVKP